MKNESTTSDGSGRLFLSPSGLFFGLGDKIPPNSGDPFLFWFWATAWHIPIYNPLMLVCCCYLVSSSAGGCQPWYFENSNLPSSLFLHCISHAIAAAYTFESFPLYHTIWQLEGIFILTWQIYSIIEIFFGIFSHFFMQIIIHSW